MTIALATSGYVTDDVIINVPPAPPVGTGAALDTAPVAPVGGAALPDPPPAPPNGSAVVS